MKVLLEFLIILLLLYVGWNKPFNIYAARLTGAPLPAPAASASGQTNGQPGAKPATVKPGPATTPMPKDGWIYQKSRLDRPDQ